MYKLSNIMDSFSRSMYKQIDFVSGNDAKSFFAKHKSLTKHKSNYA